MKKFGRFCSNRFLAIYDFIFVTLSFLIANIFMDSDISFVSEIPASIGRISRAGWLYMVVVYAVQFTILYTSNNYRVLWPHAGTKNYLRISTALAFSFTANCFIGLLFYESSRFVLLFIATSVILCFSSRLAIRGIFKILKIRRHRSDASKEVNVLIVGAGSGGTMLLHDLVTNTESSIQYNVVGFIDNDKEKIGSYIEDVKVLGSTDAIERLCKLHDVQEIIIAIPSLSVAARTEVINICNETGCNLKIMTSIESSLHKDDKTITRNVEIEDLLGRDPVKLDNSSIEADIKGKTVLVTGGGGSIGSELCRQIAKYEPGKLIILDVYENNAYTLQLELKEMFPDLDSEVIIASVRDKERISEIFNEFKPYIIFHAAAHKHVPLMERSPYEAIKNNVFGTYNVVRCADEHNVKKFVMISTDKAVNPTNIMGATKRMCEMIIQAMDKESDTKFVAVRFGNVLGSNGSVIPIFKRQIKNGGPVTITHKDITRFFMTIPEAAQLVIQAAANANGGEIFVLDMGKPVRIYDLAVNLIKLSGLKPDIDIPILITGLRPGEKLYEELLRSEEGLADTSHEKIFIGKPMDITLTEIEEKLKILSDAVNTSDPDKIKLAVKEAIPTYTRTDNK